jgi:hypothetical protein
MEGPGDTAAPGDGSGDIDIAVYAGSEKLKAIAKNSKAAAKTIQNLYRKYFFADICAPRRNGKNYVNNMWIYKL